MDHLPLGEFLQQLGDKSSTPGGGSGAAVMGAMGASLVGMVCHFTLGREDYAAVQAEAERVLRQAEECRARLLGIMQQDVDAFDAVMRGYRMPRATETEKQQRSEAIQAALRTAAEVPLACAAACMEVMRLSRRIAEIGNRNVISDAGVAALAAYAALRSAALNVEVNLRSIRDEPFVREFSQRLERTTADHQPLLEETCQLVRQRL